MVCTSTQQSWAHLIWAHNLFLPVKVLVIGSGITRISSPGFVFHHLLTMKAKPRQIQDLHHILAVRNIPVLEIMDIFSEGVYLVVNITLV